MKRIRLYEEYNKNRELDSFLSNVCDQWELDPDSGKINVIGDVLISSYDPILEKIKFGRVTGSFTCQDAGLAHIRFSPDIIEESFYCYSNEIESLEGGPKMVGDDYSCSNNKLTSLKGAPNQIEGDFNCYSNMLTSLEGSPEVIKGSFACDYNQLTSLNGGPKTVRFSYTCKHNKLTSLEGSPEKLLDMFNCSSNPLTSLSGGPKFVHGKFFCESTLIKTLEGGPELIGSNISLKGNRELISLKGFPSNFEGKIISLSSCGKISDIYDIPKEIPDKEIITMGHKNRGELLLSREVKGFSEFSEEEKETVKNLKKMGVI